MNIELLNGRHVALYECLPVDEMLIETWFALHAELSTTAAICQTNRELLDQFSLQANSWTQNGLGLDLLITGSALVTYVDRLEVRMSKYRQLGCDSRRVQEYFPGDTEHISHIEVSVGGSFIAEVPPVKSEASPQVSTFWSDQLLSVVWQFDMENELCIQTVSSPCASLLRKNNRKKIEVLMNLLDGNASSIPSECTANMETALMRIRRGIDIRNRNNIELYSLNRPWFTAFEKSLVPLNDNVD